MIGLRSRLHARAHRSTAGHAAINHQRHMALVMIWTGMARVIFWSLLLILFGVGLLWAPFDFFVKLFALVAFTAAISTISLIETAWGQVAASMAQLTAGDAHHDVVAAQAQASLDTTAIERDLERLAQLQPGPEGDELAAQIRAQIAGKTC